MNSVILVGRLTSDPDGRKATKKDIAYSKFVLALNRGKNKDGEDMGADFPSVVCFGSLAENVLQYCEKGKQVAVHGRIQTGSYKNEDGDIIYTTEVVADKVEFLGSKNDK